jgi:hypothetical protein
MTDWYCKDCQVVGTDCGPWDDDNDFFKKIKSFHRGHSGFQIGEPRFGKSTEIEQAFIDYFNQNVDQWFHTLISEQKGHEKVCQIKDKWGLVNQV